MNRVSSCRGRPPAPAVGTSSFRAGRYFLPFGGRKLLFYDESFDIETFRVGPPRIGREFVPDGPRDFVLAFFIVKIVEGRDYPLQFQGVAGLDQFKPFENLLDTHGRFFGFFEVFRFYIGDNTLFSGFFFVSK
jgi:hypothetical protein